MARSHVISLVKIGTNILTTPEGELDLNNLRALVHQIAEIKVMFGRAVIVVTSGAITCGSEQLNIKARTIPEKQAAAAVGQILLMKEYATFFNQRGFQVGQILLTKDGLDDAVMRQNAQNTIRTLLNQDIIPIINENDSVATDEIVGSFSDNDGLSAKVAQLVSARQLILLTDIDGVFTANPKKDPNATLIPRIDTITEEVFRLADDHKTLTVSRGGMLSKIKSAAEASQAGIDVVICNGRRKNVLIDIFQGTQVGTFIPAQPKLPHNR